MRNSLRTSVRGSFTAGLAATVSLALAATIVAPTSSASSPDAPSRPVTASDGTVLPLSVVGSPGLPSSASVDPDNVALSLQLAASGFTQPLFVQTAADGVARLFVVERDGVIKIFQSGAVRSTPYLNIRGRVNSSGSEQGLLGLVFSPTFTTDRHFWVSYTDSAGALQVSRFTASSAGSATAQPTTELKVLRVTHPDATNHNAGMLAFGRDGYLYISTGDSGGVGDPGNKAQNRKTLAGKILRINPRSFCSDRKYCIPASNPYASPGGYYGAIWLYGVRNVWRFSIDRLSGDLWLGDVGQDAWEEVTRVPYGQKARNLGWSCREGRTVFNASRCSGSATYYDPTIAYSHASGESVTGGYVYRGSKYASRLSGLYVFGDFVSGHLWVHGQGKTVRVGEVGPYRLASFGESGTGELYAVTLDGNLYRLVASAG